MRKSKRLITLLLSAVFALGLLPAEALAAGAQNVKTKAESSASVSSFGATTYVSSSYTVTFVENAFSTTSTTIHLVDESGDPLTPDETVDLEGAAFTFSALGDSMTAADLAAGHNLMTVTSSGTTYYLKGAAWTAGGATVSGGFTYNNVKAHAAGGLYLQYEAASGVFIPVTAVSANGSAETAIVAVGTVSAGEMDTEAAQDLLAAHEVSKPYYFNRAELRPSSGTGDAIPIDRIWMVDGYYYITTSMIPSDQVAFDPAAWNVYLVYEEAVEVTLNLALTGTDGSQDSIDGVPVADLVKGSNSGSITYQIPQNGSQEVTFTIGASDNLTLTDTGTGESIFVSGEDGYELKTYVLTLLGSSGNKTYSAEFNAVTAYTLDYTHRNTNSENYHGFNPELRRDGKIVKTLNTTGPYTVEIQDGDVLRIYTGQVNGISYALNSVAINNNFIDIPWPGIDYPEKLEPASGEYNRVHKADGFTTEILDSAGAVQATVTVSAQIAYGPGGNIWGDGSNKCYYDLTFTDITNHLKINFINLAGVGTVQETRIVSIGDGAVLLNSSDGTEVPLGQGFNTARNNNYTARPQWDYYVSAFTINTVDDTGNWIEGTFDDGGFGQWWEEKTYVFTNAGGANNKKIKGYAQSTLETEKIEFQLRYDKDGLKSTSSVEDYVTAGGTFYYADTNPTISSVAVNTPDSQVFLGWSLYPQEDRPADAAIYSAGDELLRGIIEADTDVVSYDPNNVGKASITLYPVFVDETRGQYTTYTVYVHTRSDNAGVSFAGSGLTGSVLDRETVLAMETVNDYVTSLRDYVLDGGRSDSMVPLADGNRNEFHLYYNTTKPVTVTFHSAVYGFDVSGSQDTSAVKTITGVPGNAYTGSDFPEAWTTGVSAQFRGWNTEPSATEGHTLTKANFTFPTEDTDYYAIYVTSGSGGSSNPDRDEDNDGNIEDSDGNGVITDGSLTITMSPTSAVENGQPHTPTVTVEYGGTPLTAGSDYTVTYWDEQAGVQTTMVDPGSYTVRVTILGSYAGTYDLTYTITAASGPVTPPGGGTVSPPGGDPGSDPSDPGEEDPGEDNPGEDTPGLADPDETGVSDWLITDAHIAYLQGYGDLFVPGANMTRAEVAQMFYNLLRDKDVPITVTFSDVSAGQWYAEAVQTLASLGMIQGYGNGIFEPNAPITRAEFIAIAMRFTNGSAQGEDIFTDVSANDWFYEAVLGAVAYGWVEGYGDGTFHPEASITRAEVTAIANRMLGRVADRNYIDNQELTVRFTDNDSSNWAYYDIVEATNAHSFTHTDGQESWTGLTGSDS